jgi:hypothetical protein
MEQVSEVELAQLYFSHSRIRPRFSGSAHTLRATLSLLESGGLTTLPPITVVVLPSGRLVSLNNRRLWVWKELQREQPERCRVFARVRDATAAETKRLRGDLCLRARMAP